MQRSKQADSSFQTSEVAPSPAPAVGRGKLVVVVVVVVASGWKKKKSAWPEQNRTEVLQGAKQAATLQRNPVPRSHDSHPHRALRHLNNPLLLPRWLPVTLCLLRLRIRLATHFVLLLLLLARLL